MADCITKQSGIWESGGVVTCVWVNFDILVFKLILGLFGALVSMAWYTKMAVRIAKKIEIWDSEVVVIYMG